MHFVLTSRERWQKLGGEFAKFGTVGLINTAINYALFNALILTVFPEGQLKANVVATVVATTASYFMNRHWTFRERSKSTLRREYALFFVFNLAGLVIELGVLAAAKYGLGLTGLLALNLAKTLGLGLGTVFRFWSYRTFVFPAAPAVVSAPVAAQAAMHLPTQAGAPAESTPAPGDVEFDQLTAPLEVEFAGDIDPAIAVELESGLDGTSTLDDTAAPRRR